MQLSLILILLLPLIDTFDGRELPESGLTKKEQKAEAEAAKLRQQKTLNEVGELPDPDLTKTRRNRKRKRKLPSSAEHAQEQQRKTANVVQKPPFDATQVKTDVKTDVKDDKTDKNDTDTNQQKIVNGIDADPGEFPYQAQLLLNGAHRCGGSLIHPCYVLTAKHCVTGQDKNDLTIRLGEHDRTVVEPQTTAHTIIHIIEHPSIDVAILLITPSADLSNPWIDTITLIKADPAVGVMATVTGWGQTVSSVGGTLANILQEVTIPIATPALCNADLPGTVAAHEICAGTATGVYSNACHGDSGGPLVVNSIFGWRQVGIVSWGNYLCPSNHHYAVYVSVADVRAWIMQYIPTTIPPAGVNCHCVHPAIKYDGTPVQAWYDGANCYLGNARVGCGNGEAKSFIYQNRYYITSSEAIYCPKGTFDSCNCYIMPKPAGGFIYYNNFYHTPPPGGCPPGTYFDGANCFICAAPWATTAFIYSNNFYTTPRKQCAEPAEFSFDGANCLYFRGPGPNPFIWNNGYYSDKIGANCPVGSSWDGAHCYFRKAPWATNPFLWINDRFYATPRKQCYEGQFDSQNCLIMTPPTGATAFLYNNNYYYGW